MKGAMANPTMVWRGRCQSLVVRAAWGGYYASSYWRLLVTGSTELFVVATAVGWRGCLQPWSPFSWHRAVPCCCPRKCVSVVEAGGRLQFAALLAPLVITQASPRARAIVRDLRLRYSMVARWN